MNAAKPLRKIIQTDNILKCANIILGPFYSPGIRRLCGALSYSPCFMSPQFVSAEDPRW